MTYTLRPGLTFCVVGDRCVFLDAINDRYFCLARDAEVAFNELRAGRSTPAAHLAALERMIADEILHATTDAEGLAPCRPPPQPTTSLLDSALATSWRESVPCLWHWLAVTAELRVLGFARTLRRSAQCQTTNATSPDAAAFTIAGFKALETVISAHDRCLSASLVVGRRLSAKGIAASIVIGVKLQPFKAHCYVQLGDTLVNERVDVARMFTPILVI